MATKLRHSWMPFGWNAIKPRHFREMLRIAWDNRRHPLYAWRVLTRGVCDGCALGTSGLSDWTIASPHLCLVRLNLLRLNTMDAFDPRLTSDAQALGTKSSKELRELGRLGWPLRRRRGEKGFARVSWPEVWNEIGERWRSYDPQKTFMFVTSRGITNEVYYVAQKVMRFLGTNNVDNSARLCHSPSTAGLKSTIGVAATTCSYKDWYEAELVVFLGSNPANDQPVAMKYLEQARARGVRVLSVNAYREPGLERYWVPSSPMSALFGTNIASRTWLVRVGGDLAFLNAVQKLLLARGQVKHEFIHSVTEGFAEYQQMLAAESLDSLVQQSGLRLAEIEAFADEIGRAERVVYVWSMGITQHVQGADTVRAIANLALLREHIGRAGTGLMPIRGHSGVQGGAEMGAYATAFPGGLPIDPAGAAHFSNLWGFPVPDAAGMTTLEMLAAAESTELQALYSVGGNFLETLPEPARVQAALAKIPLRIHTDLFLTNQMLVEPAEVAFVLPSRTRYEQEGGGTETSTERRVIFSPEIPGHSVGQAQSEWRMMLELAKAVRPQSYPQVHFADAGQIRAEIERAVPFYQGIAALQRQGDQFQWGGPMLCKDRKFPTASGKAHFQPVKATAPAALSSNEFLLATRRGKQFNSMVQAEVDPLTGAARDHILMAACDAERLGLHANERIRLASASGSFLGRVYLAEVAPGTLQGHWPEVNPLIGLGPIDPEGGVPDYNARVRVTAVP